MRFVVRVVRGRPVIHLAIELYVILSVVVTPGVPVHHAGDVQNMAGRIAVIARWWQMWAGILHDRCCRKFRLSRILLPLVAAILAWYLNVSDSSINTSKYLIWRFAGIVVPSTQRGGCDKRLLLLSRLVRGRQ